jgi:hypothetical protein
VAGYLIFFGKEHSGIFDHRPREYGPLAHNTLINIMNVGRSGVKAFALVIFCNGLVRRAYGERSSARVYFR